MTTLTLDQMPLYLRKYKVQVLLPNADGSSTSVFTVSSSDQEPSLRVTFDIRQVAWSIYWWGDITIYNLDQATTDTFLTRPIKQGMIVSVSAGYLNGNYKEIWRAPVFQPIFERDQPDYKITLRCLLGFDLQRNFTDQTFAALVTQQDMLKQIADKSFNPIKVANVSTQLKPTKLSRGGVLFGSPVNMIDQIATDNNMQWWMSVTGMNLGQADDDIPSQSVDFVYTPQNGIVGVPQQTQYGVNLRVLLDPRLIMSKPLPVIKIDNSAIRAQKQELGELPGILDQNGEYVVIAAQFIGDTRGQEWYTDLTALTLTGGKLAMLSAMAGVNQNL